MSYSITRSIIIPLIMIVLVNIGCKQQYPKTYPPNFHQLPLHLGSWKGKECKIDAKLFAAAEAVDMVERTYENSDGTMVMVHLAVFGDWDIKRHDPILCYMAAGWEPLGQDIEQIRITEDKKIPVSISRWRKVIPQVQVLYWYQVEDSVLFHKQDLKNLPSKILDNKTPPRLVKVMLAINEQDIDQTKTILKDFAKEIAKWIEKAPENDDAKNP
jgi:EpsI family protein